MADGGYLPADISEFTLADVDCIYAEWSRLPPMRTMFAAWIGIKPQIARTEDVGGHEDLIGMILAGEMKTVE